MTIYLKRGCEIRKSSYRNQILHIWLKNGKYRTDDFSFEYMTGMFAGRKEWTNDKGCLHRIDGPAVINPDGTFQFFIEGLLYPTKEAFDAKIEQMKALKENK